MATSSAPSATPRAAVIAPSDQRRSGNRNSAGNGAAGGWGGVKPTACDPSCRWDVEAALRRSCGVFLLLHAEGALRLAREELADERVVGVEQLLRGARLDD